MSKEFCKIYFVCFYFYTFIYYLFIYLTLYLLLLLVSISSSFLTTYQYFYLPIYKYLYIYLPNSLYICPSIFFSIYNIYVSIYIRIPLWLCRYMLVYCMLTKLYKDQYNFGFGKAYHPIHNIYPIHTPRCCLSLSSLLSDMGPSKMTYVYNGIKILRIK